MRALKLWIIVWIGLTGLMARPVPAEEFLYTNGNVLKGSPVSFNEDGLVVKLDVGGYSDRVSWPRFTQETLKKIASNYPEGKEFVEPFILVPPEEKIKEKKITVKPVPRIERPSPDTPLAAAVTAPGVLVVFLVLLAANVYAAFTISVYRRRPAAVVCGISVLLPVLTPVLFLLMPTRGDEPEEEMMEAEPEQLHVSPTQYSGVGAPGAPGQHAAEGGTGTPKAGAGLSISKGEESAAAKPQAEKVFRRGDYTFNRRFFETQFPGFFRVVPSEAEKDLVLVFKTVKGVYVAKRVSRISSTEIHLQPQSGTGDISVPFGEIQEVKVRHKDSKG
jgi:hypothetical protein